MNTFRASYFYACCLVAIGVSTNISASDTLNLPVNCFPSGQSYQIYLYARDIYLEDSGYVSELRDALSKIEPITINIKQTQATSGGPITLDASGSRVPSGEAEYQWGSYETPTDSATKIMKGGNPGSYSNIEVTVIDKLCDMRESRRITVTSK